MFIRNLLKVQAVNLVDQPERLLLGTWPKEIQIYLTVNTELSRFKARPLPLFWVSQAWIVDRKECNNDCLFQLIICIE